MLQLARKTDDGALSEGFDGFARTGFVDALRRLQSHNIVTRLAIGDYRIEDEAFAEWVRRRRDVRA